MKPGDTPPSSDTRLGKLFAQTMLPSLLHLIEVTHMATSLEGHASPLYYGKLSKSVVLSHFRINCMHSSTFLRQAGRQDGRLSVILVAIFFVLATFDKN